MGPVSSTIIDLVKKQIEKEHLVVWFDPEEHYSSVIDSLTIPNADIEKYNGSFLKIRHDVSPLMRNDEPPNLLIYIPKAEEDTLDALAAFTAAGSVIKPGQNSIHLNSRLSVVAGKILKSQGKDEHEINEIEKKITSGLLTLADLDQMTGTVASPVSETLRLIFKSADPLEITLSFLAHDEIDEALQSKSAYSELSELFLKEYGITLPEENYDGWRANLSRYLLISSFLGEFSGQIPENLSSVPHASDEIQLERSLTVISEWQKRIDILDSYQEMASRIEEPLRISSLPLPVDQIKKTFTFKSCDNNLLKQIESCADEWSATDLISLAHDRLDGIWARIDTEILNRWNLLSQLGEFNLIADKIEETLSVNRQIPPGKILDKYTDKENSWYLLDTHHRRLEKLYHTLDFGMADQNESIDRLIKKARIRYTKVAGTLAERFTHGLEEAQFNIGSVLHQREVANKILIPHLSAGKTAYLLVDAFRYEMAVELCSVLSDEYKPQLQPAIGSIPTITEIGMTSLLPGLDEKPSLVNAGNGSIAIQIGEKVIKTRNDRMNYFSSQIQGKMVVFTSDDIIPHPSREVINQIKESNLIVITSQEIDIFGESHPKAARRYFDDIIGDLKRIISLLRYHQVKKIIISADHGFLLGEEVDDSMKINSPGGNTVDLHRRIWVGIGGSSNPSYLRVRATSLGYSSDLEIATPYGLGVFKVSGGSTLFFHGGLSPQELIIPVICINPEPVQPTLDQDVSWKIEYDQSGITNRIWTCNVTATSIGISGIESRKVKFELKRNGEKIGTVANSLKGFEKATGEVSFEPDPKKSTQQMENSITFLIEADVKEGTATLSLYDVNTGEKLASQDIPIKISF